VARPQTPHVPSCRLKLGIPARSPRVRAENTREISRVHGSWGRGTNRDRGGAMERRSRAAMTTPRGKINSRTYPGSNRHAFSGVDKPFRAGQYRPRWSNKTLRRRDLPASFADRGKSQHVIDHDVIEGIFGGIWNPFSITFSRCSSLMFPSPCNPTLRYP